MKNTNRRQFVKKTLLASIASGMSSFLILPSSKASSSNEREIKNSSMAFQFAQNPLPYAYNALEPSIDAMTMEIHYTRHHAAYVKNVNDAIAAEKIDYASEIDFFKNASKLSAKARNNSGGAWNHNFFWQIMKPGAGTPSGKVMDAINGAFGAFDKFKEEFTAAAMGRFGSGWAWLAVDNGKLKIGSTPNQDNPMMDFSDFKGTPVLGIDVWEHAYYLKYQNRRNEYIAGWWNVVNWDEVAKRL
ncbi:MAG TPA: superoxide dismutase [Cyclobacteriaceae bacterium]|nr:superoxide dismutase [Cyclobacteriaceae bacterium]